MNSSASSESIGTEQKLTPFVIFASILSSLSSFQFGWNIAVINTPRDLFFNCVLEESSNFLPKCIKASEIQWSLVAALFMIGGLIGGMTGGYPCKKFGRFKTLTFNILIFIIGDVFLTFANSISLLLIGRIIVGIGAGVATVATPMFISEISPDKYRGFLGIFHQMAIVLGILIAQCVSLFLGAKEMMIFGIPGWRLLFGVGVLPSLLQLIFVPFMVESPRYYVQAGKIAEARKSLRKIRALNDVEYELSLMIESQVLQIILMYLLVGTKFIKQLKYNIHGSYSY